MRVSNVALALVSSIPVAARANTIGNGVAAVVISRWEKELDMETLERELNS